MFSGQRFAILAMFIYDIYGPTYNIYCLIYNTYGFLYNIYGPIIIAFFKNVQDQKIFKIEKNGPKTKKKSLKIGE